MKQKEIWKEERKGIKLIKLDHSLSLKHFKRKFQNKIFLSFIFVQEVPRIKFINFGHKQNCLSLWKGRKFTKWCYHFLFSNFDQNILKGPNKFNGRLHYKNIKTTTNFHEVWKYLTTLLISKAKPSVRVLSKWIKSNLGFISRALCPNPNPNPKN